MNNALDELLQQPGIWRGREHAASTGLEHAATGFRELDQALPGGGWPLGALTEILHGEAGIGELRLLMPALARLSRQGRWIALIAPPYIPYAPALAVSGIDLGHVLLVHPKGSVDGLWALEQALRAGTCGAVLAWPKQLDERVLRRLQLAAEAGKAWGVLFRDRAAAAQTSPAALRLELSSEGDRTLVRLIKCRGGGQQELALDLMQPVSAPATAPAAPVPAAPTPVRAPARQSLRPRQVRPLRRPAPQLDLPLTAAVTTAEEPLRWRYKPSGSATWLRRP
jgi:protein ImuA